MSDSHELRLYSKSSVEQDWTCGRQYYWGHCFDGRGLTKGSTNLALFLGTSIHDGLAAIANGLEINQIAEAAYTQVYEQLSVPAPGVVDAEVVEFAKEQASLIEALLRGFHRQAWPQLMRLYPTIIAIEKACLYKHDGLAFMSRPDLILADKDNNWIYCEFKTTSSKKPEWVNSWNTAAQLHSGVKAVEQTMGTAPQSVVVLGLYKGFVSYGKQSSPLIYAYMKKGNPPFTQDQVQYDYKAGFRRYATWELDGGVKKWVEEMPENILASQFPQTPPIFCNDELIKNFFEQQKHRQGEVVQAMELIKAADTQQEVDDILNRVFRQNFSACAPAWGFGCPYYNLCHYDGSNPLENGFEYRNEDHLEQFKELLK